MNHKMMFPIEKMCDLLKISTSGYYNWIKQPISNRKKKNIKLLEDIKQIYLISRGTYGSPRITKELNMKGISVSQKTVARLMRENNIRSRVKRRFRITTNSKHKHSISPNLLKQNFLVSRSAQVWVSDITYIRTNKGWLYLTIVLDLFDRKVIGWTMSERMYTNDNIIPAWNMACRNRKITLPLIFHSDRGIQYASDRFRNKHKAYPLVQQSMSRKGNCWDNAVAESFFKSLKVEAICPYYLKNRLDAKLAVFEYIETWYNKNRRHSHLGGLTINEFEKFNQLKHVA